MRLTRFVAASATTIAYCLLACWQAQAYVPNFHNQTGCLLSYVNDGHYRITFQDAEEQFGELQVSKLTYDRSSCNLLVLNYNVQDNNMESITLELQLRLQSSQAAGGTQPAGAAPNLNGFWDVSKATLKIKPTNNQQFPNDTIDLKPASDIYASLANSYSCSSLVLESHASKSGPHFKITLKRFQLQPFNDASALYVFAPSRDCSTWLTMPQIMGFLLVLFIVFTALFGVYLLLELGNQQGDIKFSKQGGMLMNQAQLDATKAD